MNIDQPGLEEWLSGLTQDPETDLNLDDESTQHWLAPTSPAQSSTNPPQPPAQGDVVAGLMRMRAFAPPRIQWTRDPQTFTACPPASP